MMNGLRNKELEIETTMKKRIYNKPEVTIVNPESDPSHSGGGARAASFSDFDIEE
jgi:hypothetical protein